MPDRRAILLVGISAVAGCTVSSGTPAENTEKRRVIDAEATTALEQLFASTPAAKALAPKAKGILVFPRITKGGLFYGGQGGDGVLRQGGRSTAYYNIGSVSFGLQAGIQTFSQVLFFMTDDSLKYLSSSKGFEVGVDGTVAVATTGAGGDLSTTTVQSPIIAFVFGQSGLMAGISIEGSKISKLDI